MATLTINRKPQTTHGRTQKATKTTPQQDKTTQTHKVITGNHKPRQNDRKKLADQQMTRVQRKNRRRIIRLAEMWPDLFSLESPKPLKVGIFDDLMQDLAVRGLAFGPGALRATLASYAQCPRYYRALMAGGARYDLKGQPCGEVTAREQKDAETRLMMLKNRNREQHQGNDKKENQDNGQGQQS
ncbi:TPA: ProQ/FINO family protein [Escherichia coli]